MDGGQSQVHAVGYSGCLVLNCRRYKLLLWWQSDLPLPILPLSNLPGFSNVRPGNRNELPALDHYGDLLFAT